MATISVSTAVTGQTITASLWNTAFTTITDDYNGGITNANISASAAIAVSKINTGITGSLVGTTDTQTLTNKTLTSPVINVASDATGDIYYRNGSESFTRLSIGSTGQQLIVTGGLPAWSSKPSFRVHKNGSDQTGGFGTSATLVTWSTEDFDTNTNFSSNRFTPSVAGKYQFNIKVESSGGPADQLGIIVYLYKNGVSVSRGYDKNSGGTGFGIFVSDIQDANGSTDYFEVYAQVDGGSAVDIDGTATNCFFSGCKID